MRDYDNIIVALALLLGTGCSSGIELEPRTPAGPSDIRTALGIEDIPYVRDDTFIGNPMALLGQVVEVRKQDGACSPSFQGNSTFSVTPLVGFKVDESSMLRAPSKRDSKIINQQVAASVSFLSTFSAELDSKSVFSVVVFDQAGGRLKDTDPTWQDALTQWQVAHKELLEDATICYLLAVKGVIQKNIIRRKFQEVAGKASGNAYGINVDGKYMSSNEDYSVDVKFGLSMGVIKRPSAPGVERAVGDALTSEEATSLAKVQEFARPRAPNVP
jgi:hypothetical protein